MFLLRRFGLGLKEERLITKQLTTVRGKLGYTSWNPLAKLLKELPEKNLLSRFEEFCMQEFQVENKLMTLQDKLKFFERIFQKEKLLRTSVRESTTNEKDFADWWKKSVEEKSTKLWLPTKIDLRDLTSISSLKSVRKTEFQSWFTGRKMETKISTERNSNFKKICSVLSTSSLQDGMVKERESFEEKEKKKKWKKRNKHRENVPNPNGITTIRIYPNTEQKEKIERLLSANRWAYNLLVEKTKNNIFSKNFKVKETKERLRPLLQKRTLANATYLDVNEEAFDSAFSDLWNARKSAIESAKAINKERIQTAKKFGKKPKLVEPKALKFRTKKWSQGKIDIRTRSIKVIDENKISFFPTYFGKDNCVLETKEKIPSLEYSIILRSGKKGCYYLAIPKFTEIRKKREQRMCAIDPGSRTFLTGYDPEGTIFEIGSKEEIIEKIMKKKKRSEEILIKLSNFRGKRNERYNLKIERLNLEKKTANMMKDCHHKASKWIAENYSHVLLGELRTSNLTKKEGRNLGKENSKILTQWSHCKFRLRFKNKLEKFGCRPIICNESYTSKTCTSCGRLNHNLGASKTFVCSFCELVIDRDVSGSRNIFLKHHHHFF